MTARKLSPILLLLFFLVSLASSQAPHVPTMQEAAALLKSSNNHEAAVAFRGILDSDPRNLFALQGLGQAQENLGLRDEAFATYTKLLEVSQQPSFPTRMAMLSKAGIYAAKGDQENAYLWLEKLIMTHPGSYFLGILTSAKEFDSLREQPRFKETVERMKPCNTPEYHQFDFWVGSFDVQNPQGAVVGHNEINRLAGGCVLHENWVSFRGSETGTSLSFYDFRDKKWHQSYYDNSGIMANYPPVTGQFTDGKMVLYSAPDPQLRSRWTYYEISPGKVRQMSEQSNDGGKTWTITWDSFYMRR